MDENGNYIYGFFQDETGGGVYRAVQDAVDGARREGADYVVVLGHMGNEDEVSPWMYSDVISHTSGIDAWLDGHSHDAEQVVMKNKDGRDVYRSACGTKNRNIGVLTIAVDGSISTELYSWSSGISAPKLLGLSNPATEKVAEAAEILDSNMNTVLARTASDLVIYNPGSEMRDGKPVRLIQNTETNLGDLCADAYMNHFEEADIAFVNGSGMREDGASIEEMVRAVSEERNRLRLESYKDDPAGLAAARESNLKTYGHEEGPAPDELYEKYGSWTTVLQKAFSSNMGMDACCGLYDEYYFLYIELGYVTE